MIQQCPLCHSPMFVRHRSLQDQKTVVYQRCLGCGVLVNDLPYIADETNYEDNYFGSDYKKQYGRTYWQDRPQIQSLAARRLALLHEIAGEIQWQQLRKEPLMDLGCAMGFFLAEARAQGFDNLHGLEISDFAAQYAQKKLNLSVTRQSLYDWIPSSSFQVVTMFYVLEHFSDQEKIWQKISAALKPGGYLLLALPSTWGPHYVFQQQSWLKEHPLDHYVDYNPWSLRLLLPRFGLTVKKIVAGRTHWDRYPLGLNHLLDQQCKFRAAEWIQRWMFGDTMEIVAQKKI